MFKERTPVPAGLQRDIDEEDRLPGQSAAVPKEPSTHSAPPGNGYRREIDGLRAIAVMLVIVYHARVQIAGIDLFRGGFIGVDIFFVISGYLIGTIVQREITAGKFSFIRFYERRARRILPALYAVLALTMVPAWFYLLPGSFMEYAGSLIASVASLSNFYFWHSGSYDAGETIFKPLIHTWSLGVEEQFYLIFPPVMLLIWRYARRWTGALMVVGCLASLLLAERTTGQSPDASFFLLPSRFWEMAVGAILARRELQHGRPVSPHMGRVMPAVGLAMLLIAVPIMTPHWHHPGFITVIPVAGTALMIWYMGQGDAVTRLLSSRPFIFIGLISYSLYLWHQPVFAFGRLTSINHPGNAQTLAWIVLAIILATATYRLVEVPTRDRHRTSSTAIWSIALAGALLLGGFGLYGYSRDGQIERFGPSLTPIAKASDISEARIFQNGKSCHNYARSQGPCVFTGPNPNGYSLITVGDSHARTLTGPLRDNLPHYSELASFTPLNRGGCLFLLGIGRVNDAVESCPASYNQARLAYVLAQKRPIAVIFLRLPLLLEQSRFDNGEGGVEPGEDHPHLSRTGETSPADHAAVVQAVSRTVRTLMDHGVKVVLVYPVPEMGWNVPQALLLRARSTKEATTHHTISVSYAGFRERTRHSYAVYDAIGTDPRLVRIYPEHLLCDGMRCYGNRGARILYRDDNHLSYDGARQLDALIMNAIMKRWGAEVGARP